MLMPNLDTRSLCNGTRIRITYIHGNVFEAIIPELLLEFKQVKLAFAMTINDSQSQKLKVAGINLELSCFPHGHIRPAAEYIMFKSYKFLRPKLNTQYSL